jgi:hypothetical protein
MSQNTEPEVRVIPADQEVLAYDPKAISEAVARCEKNIESYEMAKAQQLQEIGRLRGILARRHELEEQGITIESLKRG